MEQNMAHTPQEQERLKTIINEGIQVTQEISYLREGLRDTVKAVAEELDIKPSVLNKAIRVAYKGELQRHRNEFSELEEILETVGRTF